ncbi:MAG: M6 family metalloprotease domain-containing protein [Chitinophagaceae bacterium]|nr:M6 family metalloprotease domain-containing protein [Chitinophagaceae bacterium]
MDKFPITVTQPDGTQLNLFASGDEFYNWLQDAQGFTVIQDPLTGYYVYADLVQEKLVPTRFVVGRTDPESRGLRPYTNISPAQMENIRQASPLRTGTQAADTFGNAPQTPSEQNSDRFPDLTRKGIEAPDTALQIAPNQQGGILADQTERQTARAISNAPLSGIINNLVVFIRFSDESEFTNTTSTYAGMLNNSTAGANSLRNYFQEASYNALTIDSILYPTPGSIVVSYQDSHTRGYFQPYHPVTNLDGYTGGDNGTDRATREHTLLKDAINYVNGLGQFPDGASIDGDGDGIVDSLTFIVSGSPTGWSSLLWPHMWSLWSYPVTINGKIVGEYSFQLNDWLGNGVLAHEMFHVLGSPDLYHYSSNGIQPVGGWDVMEYNANPPQHMGCYMKFKYGGWISSIPELTTPGTYSLNPLTSSTNNCYKIASPYSATEFFVLEYRNGAGSTFESSLPGTGLLVYRINTLTTGNAGGPPDEVYIYRPGGTTTVNGNVNTANFSSNVGRTAISDASSPSSFLSDGGLGGLNICNVGASNATISFDICPSSVISISGNAGVAGAVLSYIDGAPKTATSNSSGFYTFVVPSGWSGTVTPSKAGMSFTPSSRSYTNVLENQTAQDYAALGGPDIFGYTWDDTIAMNWIDVTDGANTWLTGYASATGAIALPFPFKYYENTYNQLYIAAPGYLSFTDAGYWDTQSPIPATSEPNNVIAPYWAPNYIGADSWVRYKSGGIAPNRYFVIEWHDVKGGDPLSEVGSDDTFRFEVILHENGDIVFQYQAMTYNGSWWSRASGIEDSTGLDGLSYGLYQATSFTAVRFYRPPASARVNLDPMQQGSFTVSGETETFPINILNQGELGSDTYDLTISSVWPVTLYAANGITPLTDTDGDGTVDSGSIPQGDTKTIIAKVVTSGSAVLGNTNTASVTVISSLNISKSRTATLQSTIPAPFAQVYTDSIDGAMNLEFIRPENQALKKASPNGQYGYNLAMTTAANSNFIYAWNTFRCVDGPCSLLLQKLNIRYWINMVTLSGQSVSLWIIVTRR